MTPARCKDLILPIVSGNVEIITSAGTDLGVFIKAEDVILVSRDEPFLEDGILKPWAKHFIFRNEFVQQAISDFEEKRKI